MNQRLARKYRKRDYKIRKPHFELNDEFDLNVNLGVTAKLKKVTE